MCGDDVILKYLWFFNQSLMKKNTPHYLVICIDKKVIYLVKNYI